MAGVAQKLYSKAPYALKCWLASWNARRLHRLRHGPEYERFLAMIAEHDGWTTEQFADYERQELRDLVCHAADHVPYYRERFADLGIDPVGIGGPEDLHRLPILHKNAVRADATRFLDETLDRRRLVCMHTSGTTGTPIDLYRTVWLSSAAFAFWDGRLRHVVGLSRVKSASVSLGGHLVAAPDRTRPPFWVHNRRWNQLYMSSYHLSPAYLGHYVEAIRAFGADYIEGYPSSVYAVARHMVEEGLEPIPMKACFTTAETLFDYQREAIAHAFGCRTYNQYGCGEMVVFAAECEQGSMHLSPEMGLVEILDDDDQPVAPGEVGHVVATGLLNTVQPFIRYRLGDMAALKPGRCPCGRPLPMLDRIEGRVDAVLVTRDGRRIGRLDPVFKGADGIAEAQVVQDDYETFRIRIVPAGGYTEADGQTVVANLGQRTGPADIRVELVDEIERTAAGKFRAVVCNLPGTRTE